MRPGANLGSDHNSRPGPASSDAPRDEILRPPPSGTGRKPATRIAASLLAATGGEAGLSVLERFWQEQGLLWCAFAFAAGVALFVALPADPSRSGIAVFVGGVSLAALLCLWRGHFGLRSALVLSLGAGLAVGALRSEHVRAPRLAEAMNVTLTGTVLERREDADHARVVLAVAAVDGWRVTGPAFPEKVRIRIPKEGAGRVGEHVQLRARLFPPPGPVHPGGYDFSFRAYFSGIGATGFSYGAAERVDGGRRTAGLRAAALVAEVRADLAHRIRSILHGRPEAALVVALLVGDRGGITEEQEEILRAAGLAHILAISGLHMALFAGGTYAGVVLLLALVPSAPLRWPTHKWAALAALAAAVLYLLLSGAAVATQRSFLMIALVFLGILVGRRGLTLRSVALAGLLLLAVGPERLFYPGFQMSFAAVICLVAVYDLWRKRARGLEARPEAQGAVHRILTFLGKWVLGLLVTALVAGLATGIIGAHHFGRVAPFGVVGNLLGMPVFSVLVMPMGVLALVLMPFGLAGVPLSVMAFGISLMLRVAEFTAQLDGGAGALGTLHGGAALLLMAALFAGLLLPGRLRLVALAPLAAGLVTSWLARPPDIQIASSGGRLAARDAHGDLRFSGRAKSFVTDLWFQTEGVAGDLIKSRKMESRQRSCDPDGCVIRSYGASGAAGADAGSLETPPPLLIAVTRAPEAFEFDCRHADIVVSDLIAPPTCRAAVVLDGQARLQRGAVSIWLEERTEQAEPSGADPPEAGPVTGKRSGPGARSGAGPEIGRMIHAIPDPPRRWSARGTVTRKSLRLAMRAGRGTGSP